MTVIQYVLVMLVMFWYQTTQQIIEEDIFTIHQLSCFVGHPVYKSSIKNQDIHIYIYIAYS